MMLKSKKLWLTAVVILIALILAFHFLQRDEGCPEGTQFVPDIPYKRTADGEFIGICV